MRKIQIAASIVSRVALGLMATSAVINIVKHDWPLAIAWANCAMWCAMYLANDNKE